MSPELIFEKVDCQRKPFSKGAKRTLTLALLTSLLRVSMPTLPSSSRIAGIVGIVHMIIG